MSDTKRRMTDKDWAEMVASFTKGSEEKRKQSVTLQNVINGKAEKGSTFPRGDMDDEKWGEFLKTAKEKNMLWNEPEGYDKGAAIASAGRPKVSVQVGEPENIQRKGAVDVQVGQPTNIQRKKSTVDVQAGEPQDVSYKQTGPGIEPAPVKRTTMEPFHGQLDETAGPGSARPGGVRGMIDNILKGATPESKDELARALEGASSESAETKQTKMLESRQKTESSEPAEAPKASSKLRQGLAAGFKNDAMRDSASEDVASDERAKRMQPESFAPPGPYAGPPLGSTPEEAPVQPPTEPRFDAMRMDRWQRTADVDSTSSMSNSPMAPAAAPPDPGAFGPGAVMGGMAGAYQAAQPSQSQGTSLKMSGPGGGGAPAPAFPPQANYDADMRQAIDQQKSAIAGAAEVESAGFKARGEVADQQMADMQQRQNRIMQQQEYVQQGSKELFDTTAQAQKVLNNPAQTPDPERYWKNHSKIMFAIGVGLLAHAKGDIGAVLNSVNSAIERDIEQQKHTFEAPRNAAKAQIAGAQTLYGMLRNMGHDAFEAEKMAGAVSNDFYAKQYEKLAANSSSELVKQKALEESGKLSQMGAEKMQQAAQHRESNYTQQFNAQENARHNRAQEGQARFEFRTKQATAQSEAAKGKILPAGEAEKIGKLRAAKNIIETSAAEYEKISGTIPQALWSKGTAAWPRSDADNYNKGRKAFLRTIGLLVDESVIQKHDADAWEEMYPEAGALNGKPSLDALKLSLQEKFDGKIGSYGDAGYDVSGFAPLQKPQQQLPKTAVKVR